RRGALIEPCRHPTLGRRLTTLDDRDLVKRRTFDGHAQDPVLYGEQPPAIAFSHKGSANGRMPQQLHAVRLRGLNPVLDQKGAVLPQGHAPTVNYRVRETPIA